MNGVAETVLYASMRACMYAQSYAFSRVDPIEGVLKRGVDVVLRLL